MALTDVSVTSTRDSPWRPERGGGELAFVSGLLSCYSRPNQHCIPESQRCCNSGPDAAVRRVGNPSMVTRLIKQAGQWRQDGRREMAWERARSPVTWLPSRAALTLSAHQTRVLFIQAEVGCRVRFALSYLPCKGGFRAFIFTHQAEPQAGRTLQFVDFSRGSGGNPAPRHKSSF